MNILPSAPRQNGERARAATRGQVGITCVPARGGLRLVPLLVFLCLLGPAASRIAGAGFLQIRHGYFWDPSTGEYFVPRGVAYQIWNPPVGADQSTNQVGYDLTEFKKLHANSVRAELTWGQVEIGPNEFDWRKPDYLVRKAEELGLKLFVIIGYQYPPLWLPESWHGINNLGLRADVVDCLASSSPSNALSCLPPRAAGFLEAANSPDTLAEVLNCLVTGAKAGGLSNILECLEATLTPDQWTANLPYLVSDVINYEDPNAVAAYSNYISQVTARYRDSPAIGAWILGNEYAYFDLWEDTAIYKPHRFLGYDRLSQQSFRSYLRSLYQNHIAALNANWQTSYADFDSVAMPLDYPSNRYYPGYQDLLQWRKQSIANYVAAGARAAQQADPNHLRTYSMVGGIFSGDDANYTCEDAKTIVATCAAAGAPLDFWSINNYPWAWEGSEMRSAAFGIGKYQAESGLPVMISETGESSTEDLFDYDSANQIFYAGSRQPKALPSTIWESLLDGAIGVHFFNWNDRDQFTQGYFYRERGFGIVQENRLPKHSVYDNMAAMFRQMENIHLDSLLGGSSNPPPDVQFFWSTNADMVWPRANSENAMIWGALKRLGFEPGIIDDAAFERGAYTNAPVLLLSTCYQMAPDQLARIADAIRAGVDVHAEAELPGQFDAYDRPIPNWPLWIQNLFGVDVSQARPAVDLDVTTDCSTPIHLAAITNLQPIATGYRADFSTWKLWQSIRPVSAKVILDAFGDSAPGPCPDPDLTPYPTLFVNSNAMAPGGKTALNSVALGDTLNFAAETNLWEMRYNVLRAIYRNYFKLQPVIDLSGPGADRVASTYRICANGSYLIGLLNEDTNAAIVTVSAPTLLTGRTVEDLGRGGVLTRESTGSIPYNIQGDECAVLYAYSSTGTVDGSLINPSPDKLWFVGAPLVVWPGASPWEINVGYDTKDTNLNLAVALEQVRPLRRVYARSGATNIMGQGTQAAQLVVPDADANDPAYLSSPEGGDYVFHATLTQAGVPVSDCSIPVRLVFGVRPTQPYPSVLAPGETYAIDLAWEELPSYSSGEALPLDRTTLWDSASAGQEHYNLILELLNSAGSVITSDAFLTSQGTGNHAFSITVPSGATGPFTWDAYATTATNVLSHNVQESFEGYARGANYQPDMPFDTNNFLVPWKSFTYVYPTSPPFTNWLNEGVQLGGSDGSQSAFMVATNPAWVTIGTFGMYYIFPSDWALPADTNRWTNYLFSYDFKESHGYPCSVEMQVKNDDPQGLGKWIQYTNLYTASNEWVTTQATLDQFRPPPDLPGPFDPSHVHAIVVNVRMLATNAIYVGSFDNIRFVGPEINQGGGDVISLDTSANDAAGWLSIQPGPGEPSVSWIGNGVLQTAPDLGGPWTNIDNATNPFVISPLAPRQFFRLQR